MTVQEQFAAATAALCVVKLLGRITQLPVSGGRKTIIPNSIKGRKKYSEGCPDMFTRVVGMATAIRCILLVERRFAVPTNVVRATIRDLFVCAIPSGPSCCVF